MKKVEDGGDTSQEIKSEGATTKVIRKKYSYTEVLTYVVARIKTTSPSIRAFAIENERLLDYESKRGNRASVQQIQTYLSLPREGTKDVGQNFLFLNSVLRLWGINSFKMEREVSVETFIIGEELEDG